MEFSRQLDTRILQERLSHCDELEMFKETFLPVLKHESESWQEKVREIIAQNGYTKTELASLCGVSRTAVAKWCAGSLPSSRDDFIRIGFAAHYDLEEMNFFLQRYGKYPALYAKSLEDNVYIFVLNSNTFPHTHEFCKKILSNIKSFMNSMKRGKSGRGIEVNTVQLSDELLQLESMEQLIVFVAENASAYQEAYAKFYAYVKAFILANNIDPITNSVYSTESLARTQNWSSSMRQCVSAIRQKKWFPLRRKVIALGLHLNMTTEQINEMLQLAQMEALCPKNLVESAIIFAVDDADLNGQICCDGGNELCDHVRKVLTELNIPDAIKLLNDI